MVAIAATPYRQGAGYGTFSVYCDDDDDDDDGGDDDDVHTVAVKYVKPFTSSV